MQNMIPNMIKNKNQDTCQDTYDMCQDLNQKIDDIIQFISDKIPEKPTIGMILGSGLGGIADSFTDKVVIPYAKIPHLPSSSAPSHAGNLVFGRMANTNKYLMVMQGRLHLYEGHSAQIATILVRVMGKLGVKTVFITCAAGGLNHQFHAGGLMLINDHINFSGINPLIGTNLNNFGPRFPNMFDIYTPRLRDIVLATALDLKISLNCGVYASILGPMYATRAELQFLIDNRCDAIGMSVVQEAIIAAHCKMDILGLAVITDMALPFATTHATEQEVVKAGIQALDRVTTLFSSVLNIL
jgi:purine-nucleoside phosphorylase